MLGEGADGSSMTRTIALANALADVIAAWDMDGEMLRRRTAEAQRTQSCGKEYR